MPSRDHPVDPKDETPRPLTAEAVRALQEAEARRKAAAASTQSKEVGGRDGPDPARFGDWERNGIVSDF